VSTVPPIVLCNVFMEVSPWFCEWLIEERIGIRMTMTLRVSCESGGEKDAGSLRSWHQTHLRIANISTREFGIPRFLDRVRYKSYSPRTLRSANNLLTVFQQNLSLSFLSAGLDVVW
jgi:hypothetical protein